jgi:hypothetical protein
MNPHFYEDGTFWGNVPRVFLRKIIWFFMDPLMRYV